MKRFLTVITWMVGVATLLLCVYIMCRGLGLVPELDFGAGAYYYADIPDFDRYTAPAEEAFANATAVDGGSLGHPSVPMWAYIALFLGWGWLMWRLWVKMESRGNGN